MFTKRFGVEIELNSVDSRDFAKNPLKRGEKPTGIDTVSKIISDLGFLCEVQDWQYNHNLVSWVCKPDNSCGIEVCSPIFQVDDFFPLVQVMDALQSDDSLRTDERCSFHVHVELDGMECDDCLGSILAWWVKCEHVFFDSVPSTRKNSKYCRPIGLTDILDSDDVVISSSLFKKMSFKYLSLNTFHLFNRRRPAIEFRIMEGTKDSLSAQRWIEVIFCFCKSAMRAGLPSDYLWIAPSEVIDFLNLDPASESWFVKRLISNSSETSEFFCRTRRNHALESYRPRLIPTPKD